MLSFQARRPIVVVSSSLRLLPFTLQPPPFLALRRHANSIWSCNKRKAWRSTTYSYLWKLPSVHVPSHSILCMVQHGLFTTTKMVFRDGQKHIFRGERNTCPKFSLQQMLFVGTSNSAAPNNSFLSGVLAAKIGKYRGWLVGPTGQTGLCLCNPSLIRFAL